MRLLLKIQFFILLIGSVYILANLANLLFAWYKSPQREAGLNPFLSIEFLASLFLVLALVLNLFALWLARRREKKTKKEEKKTLNLSDGFVNEQKDNNELGGQKKGVNKEIN